MKNKLTRDCLLLILAIIIAHPYAGWKGFSLHAKAQSELWQTARVISTQLITVNDLASIVVTLDTAVPSETITKDSISIVRGNIPVDFSVQKNAGSVDTFKIVVPNKMTQRESLRLSINFGDFNFTELFSLSNDIECQNFTLTTADNKKIEVPAELINGSLSVAYQIVNCTHQPQLSDICVYTAVYDNNNAFLRLAKEPISHFAYGETKEISFSFTNLPKTTAKISSFVWTENNLQPLTLKKDIAKTYGYDAVVDPKKELRVSFIGGSITQGNRYSNPFIEMWQKDREGKITVNNAGVGGTGSNYGAMRFESDVLSYRPDIVFVEFTLNDLNRYCKQTLHLNVESIIRQCAEADHVPVVVFIHIPDRRTTNSGVYGIQQNIEKYDKILNHYNLTAINAHQLVLDEINRRDTSWDDYVKDGNVHPTVEQGQRIADLMYREFSENSEKYLKLITMPDTKFSEGTPDMSFCQPISPFYASFDKSWQMNPTIRNIVTEGYGDPISNPFSDFLGASISGATLTFKFHGTRILVNGLTGEQGRYCNYVITDIQGNIEREGTCDNYLKNYKWYEEPTLVEFDLPDTEHILTLTITEDAQADETGKMFGIGEIWVDEP